MSSVVNMTREEFDFYMQYKGKTVYWQHPTGGYGYYGVVIGYEDGFLLVRDSVATEGIVPSWISWVSK